MAQITTDNLGKQTLTLTIESVENRNAKTNWVKVAECPKKLIAWKESKVYDVSKLVAGASDEAEIEVKDEQGQDGDTYRTVWLNRFGPATAKSGGNFGGGGGGRSYQPKTKEEIHSANLRDSEIVHRARQGSGRSQSLADALRADDEGPGRWGVMASTRSTARPSGAGIVWMNRGWETGEAGWNYCRIWVGATAYCIGPNAPDPYGTNRIEVAETTRGWEFATHILGGSYGIGNVMRERICASRKEAIIAAADEALGYINHRLVYSGSNGLNASERKRVEALRDWAEQVKKEAY